MEKSSDKTSFNQMSLLLKTKAILTRLIFLAHALTSVQLVIRDHGHDAGPWFLLVPLLALIAETVMMLTKRKWEFKYVWPLGFCYITTVIPVIWIIELDLFEARFYKRDELNTSLSLNSQKEIEGRLYLSDMELTNEVFGRKVCELGLFIGLLIGRWLTPRGSITRDGLSALLLGYVGTTSDILEIFELFKEPGIKYEKGITITIILLYTLAIYQFCLVTTVTNKEPKDPHTKKKPRMKLRNNKIAPKGKKYSRCNCDSSTASFIDELCISEESVREMNDNFVSRSRGSSGESFVGRSRINSSVIKLATKISDAETSKEQEEMAKRNEMQKQLFQSFTTLFMQDGPFLILRLYVIINFNIKSEMHLYFTCKNIIVILLQVYRLRTIYNTTKENDITLWDREETVRMLRKIQIATMAAMNIPEEIEEELNDTTTFV